MIATTMTLTETIDMRAVVTFWAAYLLVAAFAIGTLIGRLI